MLTPQIAIFILVFLVLWLLSIRINSIKAILSKVQKEKYIKKFPVIKITTSIAIIAFFVCMMFWFIVHFKYKISIANMNPILFFITVGCGFLLISTIIHYSILAKITKKI